MATLADSAGFLRAHTRLERAPLVPELLLHLASALTPIWQASEDFLHAENIEPPFWAFAWPGSQALARHALDHPDSVAGRRVLDFAAGSGLAAIACARAGAASVEAADVDPLAAAAIDANAAANHVPVSAIAGDLVGTPSRWDLIVCGDVCYEAPMTNRILPWLRSLAKTSDVWLADPGRAYLPLHGLAAFARYDVPTTLELEDRPVREVVLYRLLHEAATAAPDRRGG